MRTLVALSLLVALASPARADRSHRLTVAGTVLTAVGGAAVGAGIVSLAYGVANPPPPYPAAQPRFCTQDGCAGIPSPPNYPLAAGAAAIGVGAAALGTGVALIVVGHRERKLTVAANAFALTF